KDFKSPFMKKFLLSLIVLFTPFLVSAEELELSDKVDVVFKKYTQWFVDFMFYEIPFAENFQVPWVVLVLIGGAIYFTIYFKVINFTGFRTAIRVVRGDYEDIEEVGADALYKNIESSEEQDEIIEKLKEEGEAEGEVSHFQALAT